MYHLRPGHFLSGSGPPNPFPHSPILITRATHWPAALPPLSVVSLAEPASGSTNPSHGLAKVEGVMRMVQIHR